MSQMARQNFRREDYPDDFSGVWTPTVWCQRTVQTSVTGEIGMAWGTFIETWQDKGQPPEQARVRFSNVFIKGVRGWQVLLYQRNIQPFLEGRYPKTLTIVSRDN